MQNRSIRTTLLYGLLGILLPLAALASNRESPVVKAVRRVSPAVVNISSEYPERNRSNPFVDPGFAPFFDSFFKDFFEPHFRHRPERSTLGSGVIIDGQRGLIITNAHVIANAGVIKIILQDKREFEAQVVGADPDFDLAVLRIKPDKPLPDVRMGSSEDLMIGETVIAIGNPFGFSHTVTTGVVSALKRSVRTNDRVYHEFIQIDASINPGNSGGPLLNIDGELIGINTAIYANAQGIGFAIPISKAKKIIADLIEYGQVIQPWIGLIVQDMNPRLAQYLNVPINRGAIVKAVEAGSPADSAGLRDKDIVLSIDNRRIISADDYYTAVRGYAPNEKLKIQYWREGKTAAAVISAQLYPMQRAEQLAFQLLGVKTADLTDTARQRYKTQADKGVLIVDLRQESYLARIGAAPGDIIRQLDEMTIDTKSDFLEAVVRYRHKKSMIILLQRGSQGYYVAIDL
jgi:Do/DeqQ family serine protease